jgi:hypothetical protein
MLVGRDIDKLADIALSASAIHLRLTRVLRQVVGALVPSLFSPPH